MNQLNIQDSYVELKLKLIKLAVEASKNVTTFALLEELIELHGQFCYSEAELQRYNNQVLIIKCQLLCNKLTEHLTDLADYGITERKFMQLHQTIDDFERIAGQHEAFIQHSPVETPSKIVIVGS